MDCGNVEEGPGAEQHGNTCGLKGATLQQRKELHFSVQLSPVDKVTEYSICSRFSFAKAKPIAFAVLPITPMAT